MPKQFPLVDQRLHSKIMDDLAEVNEERLAPTAYDCWTSPCESPIEIAFLTAFCCLCDICGTDYLPGWLTVARRPDHLLIMPQAVIEDFRVDFLIQNGSASVVVECDGHDFHERTKEQAIADRSRDRRLQELEYAIMRFTGREIYRNAVGCARQVWTFIQERG